MNYSLFCNIKYTENKYFRLPEKLAYIMPILPFYQGEIERGIERQHWLEWINKTSPPPKKIWFYDQHQNFVPANICSNKVLSQKWLPQSPKSSLSSQILSPSTNIVFKQFKNISYRGTIIFHGIIAKGSEIAGIFFQIIITFWRSARWSCALHEAILGNKLHNFLQTWFSISTMTQG